MKLKPKDRGYANTRRLGVQEKTFNFFPEPNSELKMLNRAVLEVMLPGFSLDHRLFRYHPCDYLLDHHHHRRHFG
jgi:hypothetical protein